MLVNQAIDACQPPWCPSQSLAYHWHITGISLAYHWHIIGTLLVHYWYINSRISWLVGWPRGVTASKPAPHTLIGRIIWILALLAYGTTSIY